ncbi:helix-turn-helix domain-containing protein [Cerasicoccus maritimus]|uniref:helix-turn-helix domain-containing protein n=1 Tax=Cerasicoccus maritimus TaxID=490089 RepID=UPI002852D4AC|nr:AraC family transcriptional regulator [Cerasicoccus maritimus]
MRHLSTHDWPKAYGCTYEVWDYQFTGHPHLHSQDYHEFFWIEGGRGKHAINEQSRLMETGYLALIRHDDIHGFSAWDTDGRTSLINFAFPSRLWYQIRDTFFPGKPVFFDQPDIADREYQIGLDERERLRHLGTDLAAGRLTTGNAAAFLHGSLSMLANHVNNQAQIPQGPEWLIRAVRKIESWPYFVGGVPEFVRIAGRSHEHVSRDCRRLLNTTPRDIVNRARIQWASIQLETTTKEIVDIAHECGYENLGHFYKVFKQQLNTTPRQHRLKNGIPSFP